jgi:hypothetical protein
VRWWKKMWKYMSPPFGREAPASGDALESLGAAMRGEIPAVLVGASLTS